MQSHYCIIRSRDYLEQTITRFKQKYASVSGFNVTQIKPINKIITAQQEASFPEPVAFIFTSQYAVKYFAQFYKTQLSCYKMYPVFCIGAYTAQLAQEIGFKSVKFSPKETTESLYHLIKAHQQNILIYCTGIYRKPIFEKYLNDDPHIKYKVLELYIAEAIETLDRHSYKHLKNNMTQNIYDSYKIICFSNRNAQICYALLQKYDLLNTAYQWHIVGECDHINTLENNVFTYKTPKYLYEKFNII